MFVYRDEEFGEIYIRSDSRACRLIFRVKDNGLQITCPEGYAVNRVKSAVDDNREKLRVLVSRSVTIRKNRVLSTGDSIPCYGGDICLLPGVSNKFLFRYEGDCLQVFCPPGIDLNETNVRKTLSRGVGRFVYSRAQEVFPRRLNQISSRLGLPVVSVTIGRGRRKLGHCTRRGEIQLSFYLMYLPEELIDYVICHELAHLKYMDHSPLFHALCNRYCGGRELLLRKQLRSFVFLLY